ncbi:hypothetical protein F511_41618 [Dorcoceras hygrometricum]|uniref:Uncharacterized protein n=1 Tax=Dorcoceras hygrometricum TaxID=472368 RepID=A0A2Z7CQZ4_9LAMI|nr:hypothetical protein F511_41618 [Dorcoceras hygrometricum]
MVFGSDQYELPVLYLILKLQIGKQRFLKSKPPAAALCGGPNERAKLRARGRALSRAMAARRPLAGRPLPMKSSTLVARYWAVGAMLRASRCAHRWPIDSQRTAQLLRRRLRTLLRGGRALVARSGDVGRRLASLLRVVADGCAPLVYVVRRSLREEAAMCARWPHAKAGRGANRCAAASFSMVAAAGRPPLRRNSGNVVTADFF